MYGATLEEHHWTPAGSPSAFERGAASSRARAMGREGTWHETVVSAGPALVSAGPTHSVERHEFFDLEREKAAAFLAAKLLQDEGTAPDRAALRQVPLHVLQALDRLQERAVSAASSYHELLEQTRGRFAALEEDWRGMQAEQSEGLAARRGAVVELVRRRGARRRAGAEELGVEQPGVAEERVVVDLDQLVARAQPRRRPLPSPKQPQGRRRCPQGVRAAARQHRVGRGCFDFGPFGGPLGNSRNVVYGHSKLHKTVVSRSGTIVLVYFVVWHGSKRNLSTVEKRLSAEGPL